MQRIMLRSKLHRARVTATEIDYEGSIAIDEDLLRDFAAYKRFGLVPCKNIFEILVKIFK